MGSPYNDLTSKTEQSLAAVVTNVLSVHTVMTGTDLQTKVMPGVICSVDSISEEINLDTGIYTVSARVTVENSANNTSLAVHQDNVSKIADTLRDNGIAAALSAEVVDYYVYRVFQRGEESDNDETKWSKSILLDIVCCASDIA